MRPTALYGLHVNRERLPTTRRRVLLLCVCVVVLAGQVASTQRLLSVPSAQLLTGALGGKVSQMSASSVEGSAAGARPATTVKPLSCEKLPNIPGKSVTTALVIFPPLAFSPAHRHPGSVTAYVIKGSIRSQMAGTPAQTYPAGTTWFEPSGALHMFAENPSPTEMAELLAVFVADEDCGPLVIPEPSS